MDPITISLITGFASGIFANFSTDAVKLLFTKAFELKPGIETELLNAKNTSDIEKVFRDAVGVIDANAGSGSINVDNSLLEALRGIKFDHAQGLVTIGNSTVEAPILVTGGGQGATGKTTISENTELKSKGTSIQVGKGCGIHISGNANIKQT